jgi:hypothetical protein
MFGSDPQKVLVISGVPSTVNTAKLSYLFVNGVHFFLDL